jgi:hypothetical protein
MSNSYSKRLLVARLIELPSVSGLACVFASPDKWLKVWCHDETIQADEGSRVDRGNFPPSPSRVGSSTGAPI